MLSAIITYNCCKTDCRKKIDRHALFSLAFLIYMYICAYRESAEQIGRTLKSLKIYILSKKVAMILAGTDKRNVHEVGKKLHMWYGL